MRGTVGCSKRVQLEVFGDPQGPSRQGGAFGGPNGVQLEVFRELQGGCSWRLLMGLKSPGLRNSSFQVYYGLLL